MPALTKDKAWVIFRADKLQQPEAVAAINAFTKDEFDAYECWAEDFEMELAKIGVEAQNEAAAIMEEHPAAYLQHKKPWAFTVHDYNLFLAPFKGSKFETLHLSALFGIQNNELLLELVKP